MLYTIGYEGSAPADFLATLEDVGIDMLVDIRDRPQSRRPGFSKSALARTLEEAGIRYLHLGELGDPKTGRDAARSGRYDLFRKIYLAVLLSEGAQTAVGNLAEWSTHENVCLLCYERDPQECHRQLVARAVESQTNEPAKHLGVRSVEQIERSSRRVRDPSEGVAAP